jgi:uncharacterized membrane protein YbhN (UPF0104 family)
MTVRLLQESRQSWIRFLGTVIAVALLVYLLGQQGWEEILSALRQISAWRLLLALILMLVSRVAVAGRWYALLRAGSAGIGLMQSVAITFAGLFASNFLPTTIGGDVIRLAAALRHESDRAVSTASIAVDRLVGMVGMATALPLGAPALLAWMEAGATTRITGTPLAALSGWIPRRLREAGLRKTVKRASQRTMEAMSLWLQQPGSLLISLAFTWIHMLCKFGAILILMEGMGATLSIWRIAGLWSFTYFITLLPISINGLGVQEVSMTFIYTEIGGIPLQVGLTLALLLRTTELAASLPGVVSLPGIMSGPDPEKGMRPSPEEPGRVADDAEAESPADRSKSAHPQRGPRG